ncbi:MAG TPA: hypothetical protein GXX75_09285 [Clostridiales bacterium]|nr:hypothetical protein [Clostridiales bacterium]
MKALNTDVMEVKASRKEVHRGDMEAGTTGHTYIQLLVETLEKKKDLLIWLTNVTEQQETIIAANSFDEQLFNETIEIKEEHLKNLMLLDEGFEKIYEGVKTELSVNRGLYKAEINVLKALIADVTDLSVKLQALEKRNKLKLDFLFSGKRKDIRDSRISSKTAANYYKTMAKQHENQSLFYDKKK